MVDNVFRIAILEFIGEHHVETLEFFTKRVGDLSKTREDVKAWFDYLDLDDHVTFGGKA